MGSAHSPDSLGYMIIKGLAVALQIEKGKKLAWLWSLVDVYGLFLDLLGSRTELDSKIMRITDLKAVK